MSRLQSAEEQIQTFIDRLAVRAQQVRRVAAQRYGMNITDEHAADLVGMMTEANAMRFASFFACTDVDDAIIGAALEHGRVKEPRAFYVPSTDEYHAALMQRGVSNPETYTNTKNVEQIRRAWFALLSN